MAHRNLMVGPCAHGAGLFATAAFSPGELLVRLAGPLLTLTEVRQKGPLAGNVLQIGVDRYLDLESPGRYLNHHCQPNAGIWNDVELRALQPIRAGDEICFDYSTTIGDGWTMACRCGGPDCRESIVAWHRLPAPIQDRYRLLGCVQRFLVADVGA